MNIRQSFIVLVVANAASCAEFHTVSRVLLDLISLNESI